MPLYDYRCGSCGHFREFRPMTESAAARVCPICGVPAARLLSAPFLAGKGPNDGLLATRPSNQSRVPWRAACGLFGCSHSHHAA